MTKLEEIQGLIVDYIEEVLDLGQGFEASPDQVMCVILQKIEEYKVGV